MCSGASGGVFLGLHSIRSWKFDVRHERLWGSECCRGMHGWRIRARVLVTYAFVELSLKR